MASASDGANTSPILQGSFTSGELAPALYARTDLAKFHSGAKMLRNFFVQAQGGVLNRAGTRFVGTMLDAPTRLIPFSFNVSQTYALVFTQGGIEFVSDGGFVTVDGTPTGPRVTVTTPYLAADLFDITFCQNADVLTITHPSYPPAQLSRQSAIDWTYAVISPGSQLAPVTVYDAQGVNQGYPDGDTNIAVLNTPFTYTVTAASINPPDESQVFNSQSCANYDLGFSNYGVYNQVRWPASSSYEVDHYNIYRYFQGVYAFCASTTGTPKGGYLSWHDTNVTPDTNTTPPQNTNPFLGALFEGSISGTTLTVSFSYGIQGFIEVGELITGAGVTPNTYVTATPPPASFQGNASGTTLNVTTAPTNPLTVGQTLSGVGVPDATVISAFGSGTGGTGSYTMNNAATIAANTELMATTNRAGAYTVSISQTVPLIQMYADINYPGACAYFQQRAIFGGSLTFPQEIVTSRTGAYGNFNISTPLRDDDAITLTIAANQVNQIRHFVSVNDLIVFTNSGAWKLSGQSNSGDVITPSNVVCTPQAYAGCSNVPPIVVSPNILYVQEKGNTVRDLSYNVYTNLYTGTDISILASHLFFGFAIVDWAFAREPWKIVWATRNDGVLLGMTYLKDQEVYAWHHHDTAGTVDSDGNSYVSTFESVCSISEGQEDVVYLVVRRNLNGAWVRCVERMQSRILGLGDQDVTASWFVDCGLQYSGDPVTQVTGLDHLVGQTVAILADGAVKAPQVVAGDGSVTLNMAASIITVGLPIQAQIETLPIDAGEPTVQGKYKRLTKARIYVSNTRGLKAGSDSPTGPALQEIFSRMNEAWGSPPAMFTGQQEVHFPGVWSPYGSMWVQQDYPLPATILGIEPWLSVGA